MKITIESTDKIVTLNGVPARIWQGKTDSGVELHAYVTRVAVRNDAPAEEQARFARELQEHAAPSADVQGIPTRLIL